MQQHQPQPQPVSFQDSKWSKLTAIDEQEGEGAWAELFLNVDVTRKLVTEVKPEDLQNILQAGSNWRGTGWTTSRAALRGVSSSVGRSFKGRSRSRSLDLDLPAKILR